MDGFLGGGLVSLFAKAQGLTVIATDLAERAIVIGWALIENSRVKLCGEDGLHLLAPHAPPSETRSWCLHAGQDYFILAFTYA